MIRTIDSIQNNSGMLAETKAKDTARRLENEKGASFENALRSSIGADDVSRITSKKGRPVDKKLMDTCVEMESIFVARMLKEMRNSVPKGEFLHGGFAEEVFEDMLYDQYALSLSKTSNLGLAKTLYDELSRR